MNRVAIAACLALYASVAAATDLQVVDGWIRLLPGGAPSAGYFEIRNNGSAPQRLVGASTPAFSAAMLHKTTEEGGRSTMAHVHDVEVTPRGSLVFKPGGYHIMLMKPTRKLNVGDKVPVTFEFASGEKISSQFEVRSPSGKK